ncbi:MAG: putative porin, partial [Woeseiaceae bacterium]|nr:putative porin [Woeseiaceae bacterium]
MTKIAAFTFTAVTGLLLAGLPHAHAQGEDWSDRLSFSGDFRLRYEGIDEEGEEERNRMRFRARLGLSASVYDDVTVVLRFATGGDNPVSANQTFDDGFSTKDIG